MEQPTPPVGDCVPVSTTGFRQSEPQLFWSPSRANVVREMDKQRRIHALLSEQDTLSVLKYLSTRDDFLASEHVFMEWLDEGN